MNLFEQYEQEWNKYKDLNRDLYSWEIFIVCYNGYVYRGDEYSVVVCENKVLYISDQGKVKEFPFDQIEHITYNITSRVRDDFEENTEY